VEVLEQVVEAVEVVLAEVVVLAVLEVAEVVVLVVLEQIVMLTPMNQITTMTIQECQTEETIVMNLTDGNPTTNFEEKICQH
jgi:hypothetical protein